MENALQTNKRLINRYKSNFGLFHQRTALIGLVKNPEDFVFPSFLENFHKINS